MFQTAKQFRGGHKLMGLSENGYLPQMWFMYFWAPHFRTNPIAISVAMDQYILYVDDPIVVITYNPICSPMCPNILMVEAP